MVEVASRNRREYADGLVLFDIVDESSFIGLITINNPKKRNALSLSMWFGISKILDDCLNEFTNIRVLVITGEGSISFSSGADLTERESSITDGVDQEIPKIRRKIRQFSKPIIAQINGFCLGGGLALAMSADLRFASSNASFGIPAVKLGGFCPPDIVYRLVELVGESQAKLMLFQGTRISAEQALRIGLIQEISESSEKLSSNVLELARSLAANAPLTISSIKVAIGHRDDEKRMNEANEKCLKSNDSEEGRKAFREKRTPNFLGS